MRHQNEHTTVGRMFFFTPEAIFGSFKRNYVYQACLETLEDVWRLGPPWIGHDNPQALHSACGLHRQPSSMRPGSSQTSNDLSTN